MEFCKAYNAATESQRGQVIPVRSPSTRTGLHVHHQDPSGSQADPESSRSAEGLRQPLQPVGKISKAQVKEIAETKMDDLNANDVDAAMNIIAGTALHGRHRHRLVVVATTHRVGGRIGPEPHRSKENPMQHGKKYTEAAQKVDRERLYPAEGPWPWQTDLKTSFDSTVEVSMRLGVDPRKADQMVRGTVNLPHGTGKTARVLVFANGPKAEEAKQLARTSWARTS